MRDPESGSRGPLENQPSPRLVDSAHRVEIEGAEMLWRGFTLADLAHVLMLRKTGLVPEERGDELCSLILQLDRDPPSQTPLDPRAGDIYRNREQRLYEQSDEAAGWIGVGRPRREASTLAYQLTVRRQLLEVAEAACSLLGALRTTSRHHQTTLMPDYTYLQRAQPTSFGHYLSGFAHPLVRDLRRLKSVFEPLNRCPAATGSTNGSRLPLDREYIADLLGFDGLVTHARDAMWQADVPVELINTLVCLMLNLDRLAQDLQVFCTREFGFIELPDSLSRASVIMPQKKNPYSLAFVRGLSAEIIGRLTSTIAAGKTPTGQMDNRMFPYRSVPRSLVQVENGVRLMEEVVGEMTVNKTAMESACGDVSLGATDLAEFLMQQEGIDYSRAHRLVGRAVRSGTLSAESVERAARDLLGRSLNTSGQELESILSPDRILESRTTPGGAAPESMNTMLDELSNRESRFSSWVSKNKKAVEQAEQQLIERAEERASGETNG